MTSGDSHLGHCHISFMGAHQIFNAGLSHYTQNNNFSATDNLGFHLFPYFVFLFESTTFVIYGKSTAAATLVSDLNNSPLLC